MSHPVPAPTPRPGPGARRTPLQAIPQVMDGETAPVVVRSRQDLADGDRAGVGGQPLSRQAVAHKDLTPEASSNPGRITDVVTELSPYLTVDDSLTAGEMVGTGRTMTDFRFGGIGMFTPPAQGAVGRGESRTSGPTNRRSMPSAQG